MNKINYQLIKLHDYNIIVSNENIKEGDTYINEDNKLIIHKNKLLPKGKVLIASDNSKHNLPQIDYNGLEEVIQKPKVFDIKVEMVNSRTGKKDSLTWDENGLCDKWIPKIFNNKIKILK